MNTIIDVGGKQYNVKKGDVIAVDRISGKENDKVEFENVLLLKDGEKDAIIGTPHVKNVKVEAKVVEHVRDKKVAVFKFKKRKGYKKLRGHKQHYTLVKIEKIVTASK